MWEGRCTAAFGSNIPIFDRFFREELDMQRPGIEWVYGYHRLHNSENDEASVEVDIE